MLLCCNTNSIRTVARAYIPQSKGTIITKRSPVLQKKKNIKVLHLPNMVPKKEKLAVLKSQFNTNQLINICLREVTLNSVKKLK